MARFRSVGLCIKPIFFLFFILLHLPATTGGFFAPKAPPKLPPKQPANIRPPGGIGDGPGGIVGQAGAGRKEAPFSHSDPAVVRWGDMVVDLLDGVASLFGTFTTRTSTTASPTTDQTRINLTITTTSSMTTTAAPTPEINDASACAIYLSYKTYCTSSANVRIGPAYATPSPEASSSMASALASCLCYSSEYYVPAAYDIAAWACANYTTRTSDPTAFTAGTFMSAASLAASSLDFCSGIGNVADKTPAAFNNDGRFKGEAAFTPTSTGGITQTGRTGLGSTQSSTSEAVGLLRVERGRWGLLTLLVAIVI